MYRPANDQRSAFIADYAAKRQAQLDRAKELREKRTQASVENIPIRQTQPPSIQPFPTRQERIQALQVTEQHFREATTRGIITPDQARQLWAVLSEQATQVSPPQSNALPRDEPKRFEPAREEVENLPDRGVGIGISKRLAEKTSSRNRKPEWNDDFSAEEPERRSSFEPPPPQPKPVPKAAARQVKSWNDDTAVEHAHVEQPPPPPRVAVKNQPTKRNDPPSRVDRTALARGRQPPPPEEPVAVVQDADEIAEFLRQKEIAKQQFEAALDDAGSSERMIPCDLCGRTFRESIIDRHENACAKANKKRKVFDVDRVGDIDGINEVRRAPPPKKAPPAAAAVGKMPKWKVQHLQFQAALKAASGMKDGGHGGESIPMAPPPDDRVACPHCSRKFAQETAARHIPHCAKTVNKPKGLLRPQR